MMNDIYITKANGERELFDPNKLINSLVKSGADEATSKSVLEKVRDNIVDGSNTADIYKKAFAILKSIDKSKRIVSRYSLRKSIFDLGPTGFPFEVLVSEIFKRKGYQTTVGVIVKGFCVEHEIDVLAEKDDEIVYVETKFHNTHHMRSDLKVALYIKARFEDLIEKGSQSGNENKKKDFWLITNTKFTSEALKFGQCSNLNLIGWNYPKVGNLQDMIEEAGLHPLTCLHGISSAIKKSLIEKDIVLCTQLKDNLDILKEFGLSDKKIQAVSKEIENFYSF